MIDVAPWELERIGQLWDNLSRPMSFRAFTLGKAGSMGRACRRLGVILDKHHLSIEELEANLTVALVYISDQGLDRVNQVTGGNLNARLTFWRFIDPPDNLQHLANLALNRTPDVNDQDKARRDQKADLLQSFEAELKEWVSFMAYRSGDSNAALEQAIETARDAMAKAEDQLSTN